MIIDVVKDLGSKGIGFAMRSRGTSMIPSIWPGMTITVRPYTQERQPAIGDVCIFQSDKTKLVAHRIIALLPHGGVRTQGDSVLTPDGDVEQTNIIGFGERISAGPIAINISNATAKAYGLMLIKTSPLARHVNHALAIVANKTYRAIKFIFRRKE